MCKNGHICINKHMINVNVTTLTRGMLVSCFSFIYKHPQNSVISLSYHFVSSNKINLGTSINLVVLLLEVLNDYQTYRPYIHSFPELPLVCDSLETIPVIRVVYHPAKFKEPNMAYRDNYVLKKRKNISRTSSLDRRISHQNSHAASSMSPFGEYNTKYRK